MSKNTNIRTDQCPGQDFFLDCQEGKIKIGTNHPKTPVVWAQILLVSQSGFLLNLQLYTINIFSTVTRLV